MTIAGTVQCVLCNATVTYDNDDSRKFNNHMKIEHAAHFNMDLVLAVCLMDNEEAEAFKDVIYTKRKERKESPDEISDDTEMEEVVNESGESELTLEEGTNEDTKKCIRNS